MASAADTLALGEQGVEALELREADRAEDVGEAVVEPGWGMSNSPAGTMPWCRSRRTARWYSSTLVVTRPSPVVTILRGWKEAAEDAVSTPHGIPPAGAERAGRILDERHLGRHRRLQRLPVHGAPEEVDGEHGLRLLGDGLVYREGSTRKVSGSTSTRTAERLSARRRSPSPGRCTPARSLRHRARRRARAPPGAEPRFRKKRRQRG